MAKTRNEGAGAYIGINNSRVDPDVLRHREQEREQRLASDDRTPAQRLMGDPPSARSALAHHATDRAIDGLITHLTHLGRR
jgi:hypothetical protein